MKIELTKGKYALVDDDAGPEITGHKWCFNGRYAVRFITENGTRKVLKMHRVIMNAPKGLQIDHINGNKLDNRSCNLRLCTHAQNSQNRPGKKTNWTGYKGVTAKGKKFVARIKANGKHITIGTFATALEAAAAYNERAISLFGEFAFTNKIG
jgi:hypothetical protein